MTKTTDAAALDQWYAVETIADLGTSAVRTRLLGQDIELCRDDDGRPRITEVLDDETRGPALPFRERYGCVWTTLGSPVREIFEIAEADEADRRFVPCGWVKMRASGLRVVENFLDMAHFPFVHKDILGSEEHSEVPKYSSELRRDVDEVWASNCSFFQPRIAATETEGAFVHLTYRVPTPFVVTLYRVCPTSPNRLSFQPMRPMRLTGLMRRGPRRRTDGPAGRSGPAARPPPRRSRAGCLAACGRCRTSGPIPETSARSCWRTCGNWQPSPS